MSQVEIKISDRAMLGMCDALGEAVAAELSREGLLAMCDVVVADGKWDREMGLLHDVLTYPVDEDREQYAYPPPVGESIFALAYRQHEDGTLMFSEHFYENEDAECFEDLQTRDEVEQWVDAFRADDEDRWRMWMLVLEAWRPGWSIPQSPEQVAAERDHVLRTLNEATSIEDLRQHIPR